VATCPRADDIGSKSEGRDLCDTCGRELRDDEEGLCAKCEDPSADENEEELEVGDMCVLCGRKRWLGKLCSVCADECKDDNIDTDLYWDKDLNRYLTPNGDITLKRFCKMCSQHLGYHPCPDDSIAQNQYRCPNEECTTRFVLGN
jgi:hypothetical protein